MTKLPFFLAASLLLLPTDTTPTTWGRGFGGMHGAIGRGGGGMHMGGGMSAGAMRGNVHARMGGSNFGGARPNLGSARTGGANLAGNRLGGANLAARGSVGRNPNMGSVGGSRAGSLSEPRSLGSYGVGSLGPGPLSGGGGTRFGFPGGSAGGFGHDKKAAGPLSGVPEMAGLGPRGGEESRREGGIGSADAADRARVDSGDLRSATSDRQPPNRDQLGKFLGLPSDGGMHSLGSQRHGPDERGHERRPAADLAQHADLVRPDFRGRGFYNDDWYRRYPRAWHPRRWAYGTVWAVWDWDYLNGWFGYDEDPIYYDYGNTVVYQDNSVYVNGQDVGTSDEYYDQASDLADTGEEAQTTDDDQWLPLGVFAMSHDQQTKANLILQLAVNKDGIIRGNYTATLTNDTLPLQGSVDKKTQRAAWTIGDKKDNVIETGIYNLTKDEAPCLVHFGKDKTEQWTLVRMKDDDSSSADDAQSGNQQTDSDQKSDGEEDK